MEDTRRMVVHPLRATGPLISFPEVGLRPIKFHAGSCIRIMSKDVARSFSNCMVVCFFLWMLICAILMGRVGILGHSNILGGWAELEDGWCEGWGWDRRVSWPGSKVQICWGGG